MFAAGFSCRDATQIAKFMGPTWALLGPTGPRWTHVGPMNLAVRVIPLNLHGWFLIACFYFSPRYMVLDSNVRWWYQPQRYTAFHKSTKSNCYIVMYFIKIFLLCSLTQPILYCCVVWWYQPQSYNAFHKSTKNNCYIVMYFIKIFLLCKDDNETHL